MKLLSFSIVWVKGIYDVSEAASGSVIRNEGPLFVHTQLPKIGEFVSKLTLQFYLHLQGFVLYANVPGECPRSYERCRNNVMLQVSVLKVSKDAESVMLLVSVLEVTKDAETMLCFRSVF
jgi:hypothetical protein